jgi:hypothetical protein
MPQSRETGARASHYGHQNGTAIIAYLRGANRKPGSNEFDLNGERVSVHSRHYSRLQSIGVTRLCLKRISSVLAAFQEEDGSYRVLKLPVEQFVAYSKTTASRGPSSGRVLIVSKSTFENKGKQIALVPARA